MRLPPCLPALLLWSAPLRAADPTPAGAEFFEKEVRPLLVAHCFECHGDGKVKGGLRLTSRAAILEGGDTGPALVPGKPTESLVVQAVRYPSDGLKMPPRGKLPEAEVAKLVRWVEMGAPWPDAKPAPASGAKVAERRGQSWAFQPVRPVPPPAVRDAAWPASDIDRFVLARLEAAGLKPAGPAARHALIRRATYDLTGLPPTPEEVDAFLADRAPGAFARVVERLLASPAYGERWGRHWLDVVRYADSRDSRGMGGAADIAEAWRYRDWVIDAFNRDLPYDRFVVEQIAGDRLPAPEPGDLNAEGLSATGLLTIGEWGTGDADKEKMVTDIVNDQVDVVSRSFLGLTVACARCHDHKFDPISQKDYYGLAGIFFSTHILPSPGAKTDGSPLLRTPLLTRAERARRDDYQKRLRDAEAAVRRAADRHAAAFVRQEQSRTAAYLLAAWDYRHRPADRADEPLAAFAAGRKLHAPALRQWVVLLGADVYRPMPTAVSDAGGKPGLRGWRGAADCPNALINPTGGEVTVSTFKLPPRSVAVHPGPKAGVAVGWQSPVAATVRVTGRVADADPVCGNGIAWRLDRRHDGRPAELAAGEIPNGGAQRFDQGAGADRLGRVEVKPGDRLELVVLPKGEYSCDTTVVEWEIAEVDGGRRWNLTADVLAAGPVNPLGDRLGNPGVWSFLDAGEAAGRPAADPALAALAGRLMAQTDRPAAEKVAEAFGTYARVGPSNPFWPASPEAEALLPADAREELARLRQDVERLKKEGPGPVPTVLAAQEGGVPGGMYPGIQDVHVHIRGNYTRLGERVPRHFPVVLAGEKQPPLPKESSGRLELARWIARPENPLTARVIANRVWAWHFGEGIVRTPSNFGKLGESPTHPELLDHLADRLVRSGWSLKQLHREILLSATYRQAAVGDPETVRKDPDNRLLGRFPARRLEAEELRDTLLAVSGRLDQTAGGVSFPDLNTPRRTVYLRTVRSDRSGYQTLFDAADPETPTEKRTVSTVAPQALFLLNHPFAAAAARDLAGRLRALPAADEKERIQRAYRLLYGREATGREVEMGLRFLTRSADGNVTAEAWEQYAQVLLCSNELVYLD